MAKERQKSFLRTYLLLGIVSFIILIFLFPGTMNNFLFKGILLHLPYLFVPVPALVFFLRWLKSRNSKKMDRRTVLIGLSLVVISWAWVTGYETIVDYMTYQIYARFSQQKAMVATNPETIRYNPLETAFNDMENSITAATERVRENHTHPLLTPHGFGYISPITPDGILATLVEKDPGFVIFDDSPKATKKVRRVDQPLAIGPDMLIFDSLERHLYFQDFFAEFDDPHYLALDPAHPDKFTAVIPKVKYRFFMFPYWAGVVLAHDNGRMENMSRAEALADERLKQQWIFPLKLARKYVELQNYGTRAGILGRFIRVPGKLEIPELPGTNQFPFLMHGVDGFLYHIVATEAEGAGSGLFRMYYINATTGEGTYYQYPEGALVYGPGAGLKRVQNLPGYNWHRDNAKGESGNMRAIEPVYIVRPNDSELYWKFTITNMDSAGVSAVAVISSSNLDNITLFKNRGDFELWQRGSQSIASCEAKADRSANKSGGELGEIKALLRKVLDRLDALEIKSTGGKS